jgi:hypothetical protein
MFRFTQEPSSRSHFCALLKDYSYGSILVVYDVVNVMAAYQPVVWVCGTRCASLWNKKCFDTVDARYKHERDVVCSLHGTQ